MPEGDLEDRTTRLVERFYDEVWNQGEEVVAREILAADFRFRGSLGPECRGVDGFITYLRAVRHALGDYCCRIDDLIVSGERAAARMTFGGVHRDVFFGAPASGRWISWAGSAFFTVAGGRITELWVLGDVESVRRQLAGRAQAGDAG